MPNSSRGTVLWCVALGDLRCGSQKRSAVGGLAMAARGDVRSATISVVSMILAAELR